MALVAAVAAAQTPSGSAPPLTGLRLIAALRQGGYVLVMRHASSPREAPDRANLNSDNISGERQLDEAGRNGAAAMGRAIRRLNIPIGTIWSSPTYRAGETVRHLDVGPSVTAPELGDGGQSMQPLAAPQFEWLREKAAERPRAKTNTLIVTHMPNINGAFPQVRPVVADGESLICRPNGRGGLVIVGRITIEEWPALAGG